ncbi:MAG: signal recognition particle-docking protein FtsY [Clostridia bacterium]|jgi:fused signal recognition particle receptor|nr:signal recognition particle-docking protein FtsY [Clostridia bacterium]
MAGLFKKLFNRGQENEQEELQTEEPEQLTDEEIEAILEEEIENEETEGLKQAEEEETEEEASFFSRLKNGLAKTRRNIAGKLNGVLASFKSVDEELFEELEEILITSDVGVSTTMMILDKLRSRVKEQNIKDPSEVKELLKQEILAIMGESTERLGERTPVVILVIGVNGVGKTTSIGKIASKMKKSGKKVIIAAADTFRAAAIDQLEIWGKRIGVDVIKHQEGADPAAVIFDAINSAKSKQADILICDTAGRLHNKKNLMEELKKISRIIEREYPEAYRETLLVLDATTGQNAISQAKLFKEAADINGLVLTKLDGTAKGGIIIAIKSELDIPVKLIGVGEKVNDLQEFSASDFVNALFDENE